MTIVGTGDYRVTAGLEDDGYINLYVSYTPGEAVRQGHNVFDFDRFKTPFPLRFPAGLLLSPGTSELVHEQQWRLWCNISGYVLIPRR